MLTATQRKPTDSNHAKPTPSSRYGVGGFTRSQVRGT